MNNFEMRDRDISGDTGQKVFNFLYKEICSESSVLEVGCGSGMLSLMLKDKGFNVKALDNNPKAVKFAKAKGIFVKEGDLESIPYKEKFDVVIGQHVLEGTKDYQKTIDNLLEHSDKVIFIISDNKIQKKEVVPYGKIKNIFSYIYQAKTYNVYMLICAKMKKKTKKEVD